MAKALNFSQSITDGGAYSLMDVFDLKKNLNSFKKPGFNGISSLRDNKLSNVKELKKNRLWATPI